MQPYPKILRKLRLCTGCDKKEAGCTRASASDTFDLQQVSDGVHGCVQIDANGSERTWFLSTPEWRLMAHTVRSSWLKSYRLSCARLVASSLSSSKAMFLLTKRVRQSTFWYETPAFISSDLLPPSSTNLSPVDYKNMEMEIQQRVQQVHDVDKLKQRLIDVLHRFEQSVIVVSWWVAQMSLRVNLSEKKTFENINLTPIIHMLFCICCLLILWTLGKCYCVKCSRISPISVFYLSQGSAATRLRCSGQCGMGFVANFMENKTVKSASIYQSYKLVYSGTVFGLTVF